MGWGPNPRLGLDDLGGAQVRKHSESNLVLGVTPESLVAQCSGHDIRLSGKLPF